MNRQVKEAQLACMMLTRLPAGQIDGRAPSLAQGVWAFPLIGLLIGALMGAAFLLATWIGLPPLAAALLALVAAILVTGGLHEDGLADSADGFGGGHSVTRKLEIMRDSRIGSYGVLALITVIGLTASAIAHAGTLPAFLAIAATSRTAMLFPMVLLTPARHDGLGHSARSSVDLPVYVAFAITALLLLATGTLLAGIAMLATALGVTWLAQAQIGGQTGDVLGATQKIAECAGWLTVAAFA